MISRITGKLWSRYDDRVILDVHGVGYEVLLPPFVMRSLENIQPGDEVTFETYYYVSERNPRPILIGFHQDYERRFFEAFLSVSGIGPLTAARALIMSVSTIAEAIESADVGVLRRLEGIGPRTADKIVAALRGKVGMFALAQDGHLKAEVGPQPDRLEQEAQEVLAQLGYKRAEARKMVTDALEAGGRPQTVEELIQRVYRLQSPVSTQGNMS